MYNLSVRIGLLRAVRYLGQIRVLWCKFGICLTISGSSNNFCLELKFSTEAKKIELNGPITVHHNLIFLSQSETFLQIVTQFPLLPLSHLPCFFTIMFCLWQSWSFGLKQVVASMTGNGDFHLVWTWLIYETIVHYYNDRKILVSLFAYLNWRCQLLWGWWINNVNLIIAPVTLYIDSCNMQAVGFVIYVTLCLSVSLLFKSYCWPSVMWQIPHSIYNIRGNVLYL